MERDLENSEGPREWLLRMKKRVRRRGFFEKQDNYSAIGIWADGTASTAKCQGMTDASIPELQVLEMAVV